MSKDFPEYVRAEYSSLWWDRELIQANNPRSKERKREGSFVLFKE